MTQRNDGGPAFPIAYEHSECICELHGMSLRDWFAGQALVGMVAAVDRDGTWDEYAKNSYDYADAMLKAREK